MAPPSNVVGRVQIRRRGGRSKAPCEPRRASFRHLDQRNAVHGRVLGGADLKPGNRE